MQNNQELNSQTNNINKDGIILQSEKKHFVLQIDNVYQEIKLTIGEEDNG